MYHRLPTLFMAVLMAASTAVHAATPEPVKAEINALLGALQSSGCEFNRNGSWYPGAEARTHLQKKQDYLSDKGLVNTTEQFIERGASSSSMSGKPYQVRCAPAAAVDSKVWLLGQLAVLRRKK